MRNHDCSQGLFQDIEEEASDFKDIIPGYPQYSYGNGMTRIGKFNNTFTGSPSAVD